MLFLNWKRRIIISKEKRKKRKPYAEVEGFKKVGFSGKILPETREESLVSNGKRSMN
jgi:hypothetical protein